ncbi:hypothetical protein CR513_34600, partial [Mucuna pruriens]
MSDNVNEHVHIDKKCLEKFVKRVNKLFGIEYLRKSSNNDVKHLLKIWDAHGFPHYKQWCRMTCGFYMNSFGIVGSNYDIKFLNQSNIFNNVMQEQAHEKIVPSRSRTTRKDVDRTFEVLQSGFAIIRDSTQSWSMDTLKQIIYACII